MKIYLIPNAITENQFSFLNEHLKECVKPLRVFLAEDLRCARALLKKIDPDFPLAECEFLILDEHTRSADLRALFSEIKGRDAGIISDAGCPCVADPGAELVLIAAEQGAEIVPLVGPSSILLALMASGLNGQNFAFNGYLPKEREERVRMIKMLEERSLKEHQTQMFMETPYRNQHLWEDLLMHCHPSTVVCVASDVSGPDQYVKTRPIANWKKEKLVIPKVPTLFLLERKASK